ncbi:hypothetical protein JYG47_24725, partial [Escherichia fergusonii]|uniref:hypothetical protein n=1 Tax=Escherichia TaxID=561 RepID=UPI001CBF86E7
NNFQATLRGALLCAQRRHKRRQGGAPIAHKMAKPCATGAESLASGLMALLCKGLVFNDV